MSNAFTVKFELKDIPARQKAQLLNALLDNMGVLDKIHESANKKEFFDILDERCTFYWGLG